METIVAVGVTAASAAASVKLAAEHPAVFAAVGIQPNYCGQAQPGDWERVLGLVDSPKVVAIGETGPGSPLGLHPVRPSSRIISIATCGSPRARICRSSFTPAKAMRTCWPCSARPACADRCAGVMHSFTGTAATAAECVELGLYISFAGMVTFKKSDDLRAVAATVPDDRILIETDSPYLSPHPLRGKRNEPANLIHTARCWQKCEK